ncbi:uncharacterized protein B0I36DRAFT_339966 [Microdochium trichocladiopsis]|uniref:Uncharacterized protein n=1 Tax=Microdochium trichocladiopsis TaxID=1682393 RepID=A0A9P9BLC1_9PEZI|nr:uncharacterized protein B0I36DRAFT_339966 [Microdochium trichocladiopsis]KAH7012639.1 hypothetical protein B0I36DRAFT_339966 [Microdochium trichocladiopsis]
MSVIAGNPTTPNDYDASAPDSRIPALVTVGVVVVVVALVLPILYVISLKFQPPICMLMNKSCLSHNQPQRDVERAKRKLKETIDLRMLNDASPSQKYEQIQGFKREAAVASTQSSAAEVCGAVFLCNLPRSPSGCGQRPTIEMQTSVSHDLHRLLAQKPSCRLPIMQVNIYSNRGVTGGAVTTSGQRPSRFPHTCFIANSSSAATFLWSAPSSIGSATSICSVSSTLPRGSL